jgi:hypothetical protein
MVDDDLLLVRVELTAGQRDKLDAIADSRTEAIQLLLDEQADVLVGQNPDPSNPEKVVCDRCGSMSVPLFWYDDQIHCRPCIRERVDDWEWPPSEY